MLNKLRGFRHNDTAHIDEHDEPTEPMRSVDIAAFVPTLPNAVVSPDEADVPAPKSSTQPFPHHYAQPASSIQGGFQNTPPLSTSYPVLPAKPSIARDNSPMVLTPPETANRSSQRERVRGNMVPITGGMCFVALQTLLLFRILLKVLSISADNGWVGAIYEVSNVFVLPFRALFLQLAIPQFFTVELYTLLAILAYGVVSRIVVHTLKALFKTH